MVHRHTLTEDEALLLPGASIAHIATLMSDGAPQV